MPLTDFLKSFLQQLPQNVQYLGSNVAPLMGQNWQQNQQEMMARAQQMRQFQAQQAMEQQRMSAEQSQQNTSNDLQRAKIMSDIMERGGQFEGGGLQGQGPSFNGGGGQGAAPAQLPSPDPSNMSSIAPFAHMFGMQGATAQGPNAPSQQQPGQTTPSSRLPAMGADSGAGGAIAPAADTPFQHLPGGIPAFRFLPSEASGISLPDEAAQFFGMPKGSKLPAAQFATMMDTFKKNASPAAGKMTEVDKDVDALLRLKGYTKGPDAARVEDPKLFKEAREGVEQMKNPEAYARAKLAEQELMDKNNLTQTKIDNASDFWRRVKEDPNAWFGKDVDKDTRTYATKLAKKLGEESFIPKQELTQKRKDLDAYSLDVKSMNGELRRITADLLSTPEGQKAFGVLAGRWSEAKKSLGAPVSNDQNVNYLVARFKDLVNPMVARETQQLSGGRAAIQLMNKLQESLPSLHDNPAYLKAAFDNTDMIADTIRQSNRHYMYGQYDPKQLVPGDAFKVKGKTYHFKSYSPEGKIIPVENE